MARSAEQLLDRATREIARGELAKAREVLGRIEPESFERPRSLLHLADAWMAAGMSHKAVDGLRLLARRYRERRMWLEEVAVLRHLLRFAAETADVHALLARAYVQIGSRDDAERHYLAAMKEAEDPSAKAALYDEVSALEDKSGAITAALSWLAEDLNRAPRAEPASEGVADTERWERDALMAAANKAFCDDDLQGVYRALQRILKVRPDDIEARELLADVYRWSGSGEGVVEQLRELVRIGSASNDPRTRLWERELDALLERPELSALRMITHAAAARPALAHDDIQGALLALADQQAAPNPEHAFSHTAE